MVSFFQCCVINRTFVRKTFAIDGLWIMPGLTSA
jgi:hypothetical protein